MNMLASLFLFCPVCVATLDPYIKRSFSNSIILKFNSILKAKWTKCSDLLCVCDVFSRLTGGWTKEEPVVLVLTVLGNFLCFAAQRLRSSDFLFGMSHLMFLKLKWQTSHSSSLRHLRSCHACLTAILHDGKYPKLWSNKAKRWYLSLEYWYTSVCFLCYGVDVWVY